MRLKHILWVLVLNIFLMLSVSVLLEYNNLSQRLQKLENTISTSVETALDTSMASEELFSEKFSQKIYSVSGSLTGGSQLSASSKIRVFRNGGWVEGSSYIMSFFYNDYNRFPTSQSEYQNYADSNFPDEDSVYERLFGQVGQVYTSSSLEWSSTNRNTKSALMGVSSQRQPTSSFLEYYDMAGRMISTTAPVKHKTGNTFEIVTRTYPTLAQMGLELENGTGGKSDFNTEASLYMSDNFCMSYHIGKKILGGTVQSKYYLTPYSLGVTYVPTEVFKPVFLANLEQMVRFTKIKSGDIQDTSFDGDLGTADGCIPTTIYDNGASEPIEHEDISSSNYLSTTSYINDGMIEYNMDSAKVKVDYFKVDFYNEANYKIVNRLLGAVSGFNMDGSIKSSYDFSQIVRDYRDSDTGIAYNGEGNGERLVARVSVKIKVQIPYQSAILQWLAHMDSSHMTGNHYGIRGWDTLSSNYSTDEDGVWYQYTTYRAVSR